MNKIYMSGGSSSMADLFARFGYFVSTAEFLKNPNDIRLIVFPGGADVDPSIYNHTKHRLTFVARSKDEEDELTFGVAQKHSIPMVGICRGAQFLVAKAGGFLYQHTMGHGVTHKVVTYDDLEFMVTSSHHQMFGFPLPPKAQLIAWSKHRLSRKYETGIPRDGSAPSPQIPPPVEPECMFLPNIGALATQWHPEWMSEDSDGRKYFNRMLDKFLAPLMNTRVQMAVE